MDDETQRVRIAHRRVTAPEETLPMTEADILGGRAHFEEPDAAELEGRGAAGLPPAGRADGRETTTPPCRTYRPAREDPPDRPWRR
ncbi:hypothetical protein ACWCRD_16010 [Streptomyces sp. NPDC002092]